MLTPSTTLALPQVFLRRLTSSGVTDSGIYPVQGHFQSGFNVPLNDLPSSIEDSTLKITSSGVLTVDAGILPSLTKALSWSDKFKVYSVSDTFKPLKNADL